MAIWPFAWESLRRQPLRLGGSADRNWVCFGFLDFEFWVENRTLLFLILLFLSAWSKPRFVLSSPGRFRFRKFRTSASFWILKRLHLEKKWDLVFGGNQWVDGYKPTLWVVAACWPREGRISRGLGCWEAQLTQHLCAWRLSFGHQRLPPFEFPSTEAKTALVEWWEHPQSTG